MSSGREESDMSTDEECGSEDYKVTADDLVVAARDGSLEDVKALVTYHDLDLDGLGGPIPCTALQGACFNGRVDVVRFLVESGASVNKRSDSAGFNQWSAIHFAAWCGHRDVVELLLTYGATVKDRGREGKAAIHFACEKGHTELVKFLLANGADVHDVDKNGYTPLFCACLHGHHELVLTLLEYGAKVDHRPEDTVSPLSAACSVGHIGTVKALMANGCDVNDFPKSPLHATNRPVSPLYVACRRGHDEVVMILLAHGAQVRGVDFSLSNPLHPASAGGHYKVVQILLSEGADVGTYDICGLTPIQNVCNGVCQPQFIQHLQMTNKAYTLKILLEHGMDPGVRDRDGLTTFERIRKDEWALYSFDKDMLALLLDYGVGTGIMCRVGRCGCNTTALMCWYLFFRVLSRVSDEASETTESQIDAFEKYFIKTGVIGVFPCDEEKAVEPPVKGLDWDQSRRTAYKAECEAELGRMKTDTIGNTSATYLSLLTRDLSALRHQNLLGQLTSDDCAQRYPIYSNMIFASYTRLRRLFLEEVSPGFFAILSPPLLPECGEVVQRYLSVKDLENIVEVYRAYQLYLDKLSKLRSLPSPDE